MFPDVLSVPCVFHSLVGVNEESKLSAHAYYEVLYIKNGTIEINLPETSCPCGADTLVLIPPLCYHCNKLVGSGAAYERYILFFREEYLETLPDAPRIRALFGDGLRLYTPTGRQLKTIQNDLERMDRDRSDQHLFLLLPLFFYDIEKLDSPAMPQDSNHRYYIRQVVDYISEHYREKLVSADIAKRFGVSRTKLLTDFRRHLWMPMGEYIMRERVHHARTLLKEGHTVAETAELAGFSSDTQLRYCFHAVMHTTPSDYRKNGEKMKEPLL